MSRNSKTVNRITPYSFLLSYYPTFLFRIRFNWAASDDLWRTSRQPNSRPAPRTHKFRIHSYILPIWQSVSFQILAPLLILALALLTSTFVMFLVEERATKFAHQVSIIPFFAFNLIIVQQSLSGISPFTFWSATFLYDFIFYLIIIVTFLIIFWAAKWMQNVIELWVVSEITTRMLVWLLD